MKIIRTWSRLGRLVGTANFLKTGSRGALALTIVLSLGLVSCGGGGSGSGNPNNDAPNNDTKDPVMKSLNGLGVDTTATPRVAPDGNPLPDTYNPLGAAFKVSPMEVMFAGFRHAAAAGNDIKHAGKVSINNLVEATYNPNGTQATPAYWDSVDATAHGSDPDTWERWETAPFRAVAAGDFDLDGRDEFAIVYFDKGTSWLVLRTVDDQLADFSTHEVNLIPATSITGLGAATADTDGDARDELLVGATDGGVHTLYRFTSTVLNDFIQQNAIELTPTITVVNSGDWRITAGNLDLDPSEELAVVINQLGPSATGASDYFVFDDESSGLALRDKGETSFSWPGHAERIVASDIAIADVDGNGIGNLVIGGLNRFNTDCTDLPDYVAVVFDLGSTGLEQLAATYGTPQYSKNTRCGAYPFRIQSAWTNVVDMEGAGTHNIVINQMVFNADIYKWNADPTTWTRQTDVHHEFSEQFLPNSSLYRRYAMRYSTAAVAVADVTGNGKDNILLYHRLQRTDGSPPTYEYYPEVRMLEYDAAGAPSYQIASRWYVDNANSSPAMRAPLIVPADVDDDGMVMTPVTHDFVFSEPVIQAVLAAPPCKYNIGQNLDACTTSYGKGSSKEWGREGETTIKAGLMWGWDIEVGVSWIPGAKAGNRAKITAEAGVTALSARSYSLEKSITYESGAMEDTVVFTTIPYDRYTYNIISHPDPSKVGTQSFLMLPRTPRTLQVERNYYNEKVTPSGGAIVDDSVLPHTIGRPDTYYTVAQRDSLMDNNGIINPFPLMTPLATVGQGMGNTQVELTEVSSKTRGAGVVLGASFEIEFTGGGVLAGYSVGVETSQNIQRTEGSSLAYSGSVGNIAAANHAANLYSFGLFTYNYDDPVSGQQYPVINYWVE